MAGDVVVATDFSPSAREAIGHAARIAAARGVGVRAVAITDSDHAASLAAVVPQSREEVDDKLLERTRALLERELADAGHPEIRTLHAAIGRPGAEINAYCERVGASLLVMGYHGRTEAGGGPGGVASRCVRHAPCHVLLTRRNRPGPFMKVAVGVDFSDRTAIAVGLGAEMAEPDGGEVVLLHAWADPFESMAYTGVGFDAMPVFPRVPPGVPESLQTDLDAMADAVRPRPGGGVRAEVVLDTHYGRAIAGWCDMNQADLTVVGTRGKPGLRYWLLGSTAEFILKETKSAVLAVRHAEE